MFIRGNTANTDGKWLILADNRPCSSSVISVPLADELLAAQRQLSINGSVLVSDPCIVYSLVVIVNAVTAATVGCLHQPSQ